MSMMNGVWHDAGIDPPESGVSVLAVKELKSGRREICLAHCVRDYEYYDYEKKQYVKGDYWVTGGGNHNVILWMPLPKIPEKGTEPGNMAG